MVRNSDSPSTTTATEAATQPTPETHQTQSPILQLSLPIELPPIITPGQTISHQTSPPIPERTYQHSQTDTDLQHTTEEPEILEQKTVEIPSSKNNPDADISRTSSHPVIENSTESVEHNTSPTPSHIDSLNTPPTLPVTPMQQPNQTDIKSQPHHSTPKDSNPLTQKITTDTRNTKVKQKLGVIPK